MCVLCLFLSLSEQSRLAAEHKKLLQLLTGRYEDSVQWNVKYKVIQLYMYMYKCIICTCV